VFRRRIVWGILGLLLGMLWGGLPVAKAAAGADAGSPFVKLDAAGKELPADATSWVMVRDTQTGLIWEAKTTDGSVHDAGNLYTWQETKEVFLAELNGSGFGGFNDWRLPNDKEINSLMRRDKEEPFVDTDYFPNVGAATYWNFYICGSGAVMSSTESFGKKRVRAAKQHALAVRGKEL